MHTLAEAASLLGLRTPWILRKCLHSAAISPVSPPGDRRRKLLSDDDLDALRRTRDTLWPIAPVARSEANLTAQALRHDSSLLARLDALERRVAALEARRQPVTLPAPHEPPDTPPSDIPDGAMQLGPFATLAGIPETTLRDWVKSGAVEVVNRPSRKPGQTERWVTPQGQQQARERAARRGGA